MFTIWIVFGGSNTVAELGRDAINEYAFDTEAERSAFLMGVQAMDGWTNYETFDSEEDAEKHVEQYAEEEGE